ncbi:MAG: twin-arginine translocation signal domain-containing protein [Jatrophihabitantaceae bacterium]
MPDSTRRNFLIATGAGAAAVGVASALPGSAAAQPEAGHRPASLPADAQPLVAHVSDPRSGSVSLLVGEHEVTVHDPDLVARLARAAASKGQEG